ncbi:MAG: Smr/MutS family protein [Bdellovibrionales bacterium]|nr:Smr/MutS family protein [Bdellovibrionales bacterium]
MAKKQNKNIKTLDLHGYAADDVVDAIDRFIMKVQSESQVRIMTGKGKGVVKKLTMNYLKQAKYPWKYEVMDNGKANEGVLVVFIN